MKKCISLILCAVLLLTAVVTGSLSVSAGSTNTGATLQDNGLSATVEGGAILHCWCWSFNTIREKMPEIAAAGFSSIQTSPICEVKNGGDGSLTISGGDNWWWHYQPTDYKIGNYQLGTQAEFRAMCDTAHSYGIKVIVDAVLNHCTADYNKISPNIKNLSGESFHPKKGSMNEADRYEITQHDLSSLYDLNTQNKAVQNYLLSFLKTCVENGADGFRYDAAKHIELPDDTSAKYGSSFASDFWPTILQNGSTFQYGEILQESTKHPYNNTRIGYDDGDSSRLSAYQSQTYTDKNGVTRYFNTTNSFTGHRVRDAISKKNLATYFVMDTVLPQNAQADRTVTWVESHDNFCNEASYQQLDNQQVILAWTAIAARRDGTPLFFDRPNNSTASNPWGDNKIGPEGSDMYKDPQVVAVNFFRNEMGDTPQTASNPIAGNNQVLMIERGDANKGAVIINASDKDVTIQAATGMAEGVYTDQAFNGQFTVSGGVLSGTVKAGRAAVVYNPETPDSDKVGFTPYADLSVASGYFFTDTLDVEVAVRSCDHAAYTLTVGGSSKTVDTYAGDTIRIKDLANNQTAKITLTGYDKNNKVLTSVTREYTRWIKQNNTVIYMDPKARSSWSQCYAYIWGSHVNKTWPGEKMTLTSDGLYRYVLPYEYELPGSYGNVIFNSGAGQQFDAGRIEPGQKMIYTADGKWIPYDEPEVTLLGDVDGDGEVTILDATSVQRKIAKLSVGNFNEIAADTDGDHDLSVLDATVIQRYLAKLSYPAGVGEPIT